MVVGLSEVEHLFTQWLNRWREIRDSHEWHYVKVPSISMLPISPLQRAPLCTLLQDYQV